jgi:hypothetical protein
MTTKTIECRECGETVEHGRLACSGCGALLASLAGSARPGSRVRETPIRLRATALDAAAVGSTGQELRALLDASGHGVPAAVIPVCPSGTDRVPAPGAYRPPAVPVTSAAQSSAVSATARPIVLDQLLRLATLRTNVTAASRDRAMSAATLPERVTAIDIAGWFVMLGATMSVLGFLLPWSRVEIFTAGVGGSTNGLALASPAHLVLFGCLLGTLALATLRAVVPTWLRTAMPGLALGGVVVGLVWPFLGGSRGVEFGTALTALGGCELIVGGAIATWATRHAE